MATARFSLDDMKEVKKSFPKTTINDVLLRVVSYELSRYLDHRTPNGVTMINIRAEPGTIQINKGEFRSMMGNRFGAILLPVYYHKAGSDFLEYLKRLKVMVDRKKLSM